MAGGSGADDRPRCLYPAGRRWHPLCTQTKNKPTHAHQGTGQPLPVSGESCDVVGHIGYTGYRPVGPLPRPLLMSNSTAATQDLQREQMVSECISRMAGRPHGKCCHGFRASTRPDRLCLLSAHSVSRALSIHTPDHVDCGERRIPPLLRLLDPPFHLLLQGQQSPSRLATTTAHGVRHPDPSRGREASGTASSCRVPASGRGESTGGRTRRTRPGHDEHARDPATSPPREGSFSMPETGRPHGPVTPQQPRRVPRRERAGRCRTSTPASSAPPSEERAAQHAEDLSASIEDLLRRRPRFSEDQRAELGRLLAPA